MPTVLSQHTGDSLQQVVVRLRDMAVDSLVRMYHPNRQLFGWCLRNHGGDVRLEGVSGRYTATVLLSLADEPPEVAAKVLHGQNTFDVYRHLAQTISQSDELGEVALTLWAGRALDHPDATKALSRLRTLDPVGGTWPTVEVAWSLMGLSVDGSVASDAALADAIADRLIRTFNHRSKLFGHWPGGSVSSSWRSHVTCFADFVYPVQALSTYHRATGHIEAMAVADRCAEQMCSLQGPAGQWWWHFDVRTGRVVERYPVYSVHQDSMAPMALMALGEAGGTMHFDAIARGLNWLIDSPEISGSLIDTDAGVIWRKVARREPGKLVRGLQAGASRLCSPLRVPGMNLAFRPGAIDFESRPYHMGWILHAFNPSRQAALPAEWKD